MNRRFFIKSAALGTAGILTGSGQYELMAAGDFAVITVLHTNDLHSRIEPFEETHPAHAGRGGFARISAMIKEIRNHNPGTLLFDAGDSFQGTPYFNYHGGGLIYRLMSAMGYDAATVGNHEFDNGLEGLDEGLKSAEFPLIISNYDFSDTIIAGKTLPWKIFRKSGLKVGVYGLGIEPDGLVSPVLMGNTRYLDPLKTALEIEKFLKFDNHCDLVVCISHLGLRYHENRISDEIIARETYSTDLITGGHTHTFLEEPLSLINRNGLPVIVNQAWWGGLVLGQIDFIFERSKKKKERVFASNLLQQ